MPRGLVLVLVALLTATVWAILFPPWSDGVQSEEPGVRAQERERESSAIKDAAGDRARQLVQTTGDADVDWQLTGVVRSSPGEAIDRATVTLKVFCDHREIMKRQVTESATDGSYRFDLSPIAALPLIDLYQVRLRVTAVAPGHVPGEAKSLELRDNLSEESEGRSTSDTKLALQADISLQRGTLITGRVINEHGQPVHEANVMIDCDHGGEHEAVADTWTSTDGRFHAGTTKSGVASVIATKLGVGTAVRRELVVAIGQDLAIANLVLESHQSVSGTLMFENGQPIRDFELAVTLSKAQDGTKAPSFDRDAASTGKGLARGFARTDARGRFVVRGLWEGMYKTNFSIYPLREKEIPAFELSTSGPPTHIVLPCHRIQVRFEDSNGRELHHRRGSFWCWRTEKDALVRRFADGEDVFEGRMLGADTHGSGIPSDHLVQVGSWWLIEASTIDGHQDCQLVRASGGNETLVTLRLRKGPRDAMLRVRVEPPNGAGSLKFAMRLDRLLPGFDAEPEEVPTQDDGKLFRCNPGLFALQLKPGAENMWGFSESYYFQIDRKVRLASGQETTLTLRAVAGGHARMTVKLPPGAQKDEWHQVIEVVTLSARGRAGVETELGPYRYPTPGQPGSVTMSGAAPSDIPFTCGKLLPPGRHVLKIKAEGCNAQEVAVEVFPGKVTDIGEISLRKK